jgi:hypothetical protein
MQTIQRTRYPRRRQRPPSARERGTDLIGISKVPSGTFPAGGVRAEIGLPRYYISGYEYGAGTHLCILELLNFVDKITASFTYKATEEELMTDFASLSDDPADAHQSPDLVRSQIMNTRNKRHMVNRDIKLTRRRLTESVVAAVGLRSWGNQACIQSCNHRVVLITQ